MLILFLVVMINDCPMTLLEMNFTGADRELAQGAIERHELLHREIEPKKWLIAVEQGTPAEWASRLTDSLPPDAGTFEGTLASERNAEKVRKGETTLQR